MATTKTKTTKPSADLLAAAKRYMAAEDEYSSWVNDPESHPKTHREPGAGYYRAVQEKERRAAEAFASLAGIKGLDWRTLRPVAYAVIAAGPPEAPKPITPGASNRHNLHGGPGFVEIKGHDNCYPGWSCPDERHDKKTQGRKA